MKAILILLTITIGLAGCEPKKVTPLNIGKIWRAKTVRENDIVVFEQGNAKNTNPGYEQFRLDLTAQDVVVFTDLDGRRTTGKWTLSTDNNRLIFENLIPPPSSTSGNIEFYITSASSEQLDLNRTNESRKTGNKINAYELVPE